MYITHANKIVDPENMEWFDSFLSSMPFLLMQCYTISIE